MVLERTGDRLEGLYASNGSATALRGDVVKGGTRFHVSEVAPKGKKPATFDAAIDGAGLVGTWTAPEAGAAPVPFKATPLVLAKRESKFKQAYLGLLAAKTHIRAQLERSGDKLSGIYRYTRSQENLHLDGTVSDAGGAFTLEEKNGKGVVTGVWKGVFLDQRNAFGRWTSPDGARSFPFLLSEGDEFPSPEPLAGGARLLPQEDFTELAKFCTVSVFFPEVAGLADAPLTKKLNAALKGATYTGDAMWCEGASAAEPYSKVASYHLDAKRPGAVTLHYSLHEYTGGAHPNYVSRCYAADLATGILTPLTAKLLAPSARKRVEARALPEIKQRYDEAGMEWTPRAEFVSDATSICVDGDDLVVEFQPYEIGPYVLGALDVKLPRAEAASLVAGTPLAPFFP